MKKTKKGFGYYIAIGLLIFSFVFGYFYFQLTLDFNELQKNSINLLTKKPGELTQYRFTFSETKPKPFSENSKSQYNVDDIFSPFSVYTRGNVSKKTVISNLRKKLSIDSNIENWTICDFMSLSEENYAGNSYMKIKTDFEEIIEIVSNEIVSDCKNDLSCDPLFKEISKFNSTDDLDWVRAFSFSRSASDIMNIGIEHDSVKFFKALVLGNQMVSEKFDVSLNQEESLNMLTELKNKYPGNGVYPYFLMSVKYDMGLDYRSELQDFLNSTYLQDPLSDYLNFLFRQGLTSESLLAISKVRRQYSPIVSYSNVHDNILKFEIPNMSEENRKKLDVLASKIYLEFLHSNGRLISRSYYSENWLRRTHSKNVDKIQDFDQVKKNTSLDNMVWERVFDSIYSGKCKRSDELNKVLTSDLNWFSEWSKTQY